ncbi:hypothetical protein BDP_0674 [Bifidobacterium dentium Bd1]|uniref:Uncharacterized protein n=1 Tax=Bifidobacterium dentium (strain ATCC 27534 / DSM 20436 / JCM 1195 / Bd1) TaxID=401473 RepID=D2Q951_BIFDB|nr:hypothetical protein BDP_0674 [Bifidobacterium dentium Bd1]
MFVPTVVVSWGAVNRSVMRFADNALQSGGKATLSRH